MAPSSQMFSQGGIRSRDWFSERLKRGQNANVVSVTQHVLLLTANAPLLTTKKNSSHLFRALHISIVTSTERAMVIGYGDSNTWQSKPSNSGLSGLHCRKWLWEEKVKRNDAEEVICQKLKILRQCLHTYQLVQSELWAILRDRKPPSSSSHSGSAHITWEKAHQAFLLHRT